MTLYAGYKGLVSLGGTKLRFSDGSISAKQGVNIPDLIMGDDDHDAFNYEKITVGGSLSGPVAEDFSTSLLTWACQRTGDCGTLTEKTIDVWYYCGSEGKNHQQITGAYCNSLQFTCAAGDIAQWSVEIVGKKAGTLDNQTPLTYTDTKRLITWDKVRVTVDGLTNVAFQNFELTIANNAEPVYAITSDSDLFPNEVIPGIRTISGSFTVFSVPGEDAVLGADAWGSGEMSSTDTHDITIDINGTTITVHAKMHRIEPKSSVGTVTSTIAFKGVGNHTGSPWT